MKLGNEELVHKITLKRCIKMLATLLRAESWLRSSVTLIWGRLLRKQAWGKDEEMGGGGQGWTDWARPTQTQEVPLLCGKYFIITAKAFYFSHCFLFIKDPWEFWFSVSLGHYYRQTHPDQQNNRAYNHPPTQKFTLVLFSLGLFGKTSTSV